jgi:processive 1,2-diacylglycerol beta-glucosyltransferase/1,2-diacylglycerol 3-beta-galactosyltransferase
MDNGAERILILYLKTGGGHISASRSLAEEIQRRKIPDTSAEIVDGIAEDATFVRWVVEAGYRQLSGRYKRLWAFVYEITRLRFFAEIGIWLFAVFTYRRLSRLIRDKQATRLVVTHHLLEKATEIAIKRSGREVPTVTIVTDPISAHPIWFHEHPFPFIVFTQTARELAMKRHKVAPERVREFPIILNRKFKEKLPEERVNELRHEFGFRPDRPIVLIAGGGEGLPGGALIFRELLRSRVDFDVALVCGKSRELYRTAQLYLRLSRRKNGKVFGFTRQMYELMNLADIIVAKAGPATVMEALVLEKPLVIVSYMYGQERGNVDFVVKNRLGFFIERPSEIRKRIEEVVSEPGKLDALGRRIRDKGIENGTEAVADYLLSEQMIADCRKPVFGSDQQAG